MTLSCHQLDLIWSAPSPATWSDDAASRCWGGTRPFRNSLIKAVIRPNPRLPNELLGEAGVPNSSGGWDTLIHASAQCAGGPPSQLNCEHLFQTYSKWSNMHLEPQHGFRNGIINCFIINIHQTQRLTGEGHWLCCLLGVRSWPSEKTFETILIVTDVMLIKLNWTELNLIINDCEDVSPCDDWVKASPELQLLWVLLVCTGQDLSTVVRGSTSGDRVMWRGKAGPGGPIQQMSCWSSHCERSSCWFW